MEQNINIVIQARKEDPFARVNKELLDDPRLSFQAKGIMAYLLGKPKDWKIRIKDLANKSSNGKFSIQAALNELRDCGYAKYEQVREKGVFKEGNWKISDFPIFLPEPGFPVAVKPVAGNQCITKNKVTKNDITKKSKESKESRQGRVPPKGKPENNNVGTRSNAVFESCPVAPPRNLIPATHKPDRRSKEEKLSTLPVPDDYPSEEEFNAFVDEQCPAVANHRQDIYIEFCRHKWRVWNDIDEIWKPIVFWKEFVLGLDERIFA